MKRIYKWLIYYAVAVLVTSTVAYLLGARFHTSLASLIPLGVTAAILYHALIGRRYENWKASLFSSKFSKRDGDRSFHRRPSSDYDTTTDRIDELVFRIVLPYAAPFIFLGDNTLKITASGITCLLTLIALPFYFKELANEKKRISQRQEQMERELEEQKKREEMGEWK